MVTIQHLARHEANETQSLDLRSSKPEKIHRIESLERFNNLRSLNLSNNMIVRIQNLSALVHLRILNLEFNQISKVEGIKTLTRLEELFLSYNSIDQIAQEIKYNQMLRVIHIAYNDLRSIEDIRPLSGLPSLSILSLVGNPFLSALNYVAFVKMLIPSLLLLDNRDANQTIISANVYPHEEIFILKDALNKLLDERNSFINESTNLQPSPRQSHPSQSRKDHSPERRDNQRVTFASDHQDIIGLLEQWITNYQRKIEVKKLEINELSQSYSQCMKTTNKVNERYEVEVISKINRYRIQEERGALSPEKKEKLNRLSRDLEKSEQMESQNRQESRTILQMLKNKESEYGKLKEKEQILKELKEKLEQAAEIDSNKLIMTHILYGSNSTQELSYKQLKRYLYDSKGILYYLESLTSIIFGEEVESERVLRLKEFLGEKSLIEIINNLKEMGIKHKKQKKKYEKERTKLLEKFQTQAQELCDQWRQLENEKWLLRNSRNTQSVELSRSMLEERYSIVQAEQRKKIMHLKKQKEHYETKIEEMSQKYETLQLEFERKYKQLEQFQRFFQEFKNQREIVNGLKEEIETTTLELQSKKHLQGQLESNVRELSVKEATLLEKSSFYERKCYEKAEELKLIEQKLRTHQQRVKKASDDFNLKSYQFIGVQQQISKSIEQLRDYDKKIERQRSNLDLYEQKLRNLSELQNNKRNNLTNLESQIELERKHLMDLNRKVEQSEQKLNRCIESSYQYQLKIQENKKSIESLSDINKVISDMMERQSQLKRSVLQLELENQHLLDLKSKMMSEIKMHYDDQDESL